MDLFMYSYYSDFEDFDYNYLQITTDLDYQFKKWELLEKENNTYEQYINNTERAIVPYIDYNSVYILYICLYIFYICIIEFIIIPGKFVDMC